MIYLTKEDWNNLILPKFATEELFNQEFSELSKIYNCIHFFTRKIFNRPNEQQSVLIAAQIIFHKFQICSDFSLNKYSSEELYILSGACICIGQKAINILATKIEDISIFIKQIINKKNPTTIVEVNDLNKKLIKKEFDILTSIGFNIEIDSPFLFFNTFKKYLSKSELNSENFIILLNYIIKDSFILPLSLYYTPNVIAISCIQLLKEKYHLNFINITELISLSEYQISDEEIRECASFIKKLEILINSKKSNKQSQSNNDGGSVAKPQTEKDRGAPTGTGGAPISSASSLIKVIPSIKMNIE